MTVVATIGKVVEIVPIERADLLEQAVVVCGSEGKWHGVVRKGEFHIGSICEVYLPDALLPETDSRFNFMERNHYLVKIQTLRGARSECLIMPLSSNLLSMPPGSDIGDLVGVTKFEKPLPLQMRGDALGLFPTHLVPKTDEPLFQKVPEMVDYVTGRQVSVTQKCDGSSITFYKHGDHIGVCSRNYELKPGSVSAWELLRKCKIDEALKGLPFDAALQAEMVGPGIQGNPMGLSEVSIRAFSLYNIESQVYLNDDALRDLCAEYHIPVVELLYRGVIETDDDSLLKLASAYNYPNRKPQEGIVIRPVKETVICNQRVSFKVINPNYRGK